MGSVKTALITGAAKRIGATIAQHLHDRGMNIILHYRNSKQQAQALCEQFNQARPNSASAVQADLNHHQQINALIESTLQKWQRLDVLINNASSFYPTPLGHVQESQWCDLLNSNLKAPFFLSQAFAKHLRESRGSIINIVDIHGTKPLRDYSVYCIAKAGLIMLSQALAKELAPEVRVNAIAPGAILWPEGENNLDETVREKILNKIPLHQVGTPYDIAKTVAFLIDANYVTGQIIAVDGGRSLNC